MKKTLILITCLVGLLVQNASAFCNIIEVRHHPADGTVLIIVDADEPFRLFRKTYNESGEVIWDCLKNTFGAGRTEIELKESEIYIYEIAPHKVTL